jgi:hypothetical protein
MQLVGELANRSHQFRRPRQGGTDCTLKLRRVVDIQQLRARAAILEGHHRLVGQQEFVECRGSVRTHHVHLREQVQDVVVIGEAQVRAFQRAVLGSDFRVHLRVEGDDPAPFTSLRQPLDLVVQDAGSTPGR